MIYKANDYTSLLGLKGFSKELLKNHFTLYEGYVKNANRLLGALTGLPEEGKTPELSFTEIKRRLSFELNGIKLHEYYFENMSRDANGEPDTEDWFYRKVIQEFGSYQNWQKSFRSVASTRGVGWAIAIYDPQAELVINTWVDEHHIGHVVGTIPLLVLDLWEHAMLLDYGSDREKYMDAFFDVIHWPLVSSRFEKALELEESHQR
ncbi:MAG TPA: Fe-Mn family superoxide dismutase [bacterium]|nr:Fe-Mn family superoxide dismutase [bacterium]